MRSGTPSTPASTTTRPSRGPSPDGPSQLPRPLVIFVFRSMHTSARLQLACPRRGATSNRSRRGRAELEPSRSRFALPSPPGPRARRHACQAAPLTAMLLAAAVALLSDALARWLWRAFAGPLASLPTAHWSAGLSLKRQPADSLRTESRQRLHHHRELSPDLLGAKPTRPRVRHSPRRSPTRPPSSRILSTTALSSCVLRCPRCPDSPGA